MGNIVLYGMRGSGKTTIGKLLAERIGYQFYDLDISIQEDVNMPVFQFVKSQGWEVFRKMEHDTLVRLLEVNENKVISLGGGTILSKENQSLMSDNETSILIFIDCPLSEIEKRIQRDMCEGKRRNPLSANDIIGELKNIYSERYPIYLSLYDYKVSNTGAPLAVVEAIIKYITIN